MRKLSNWLLPAWARPDHPLLQYELSSVRVSDGRRKYCGQLLTLALLLGASAAVFATSPLSPSRAGNPTGVFWQSVYYPTLVLQLVTVILALGLGAAAVGSERNRKTWDNLRVTEFGASLALRARWAGILYRLRAPITVILLVRIALIGGMLYDLTAFGGLYPEMLGAQATPPLPEWRLDLLLIALVVTVNILLPFLAIAAGAAGGILLSVAVKERIYALIWQMLLIAAQLLITVAGALAIAQMIRADVSAAGDWHYALFFSYTAFGDWGLLLAQLGSLGEIWRRVPFGFSISLGHVILIFVLALAADGMMSLAARLSESRG